MLPSSFIASAFAMLLLLTFGATLQRLQFPTNVPVHNFCALIRLDILQAEPQNSLVIASNFSLPNPANIQFSMRHQLAEIVSHVSRDAG